MNYNIMNYHIDDINRFWSKVSVKYINNIPNFDDCMNWVGGKSNSDSLYGCFYINGKNVQSHRFIYECFNGLIPNGMLVCHSCDNPSCVNPYHLWLGTHQLNNYDKMIKGRSAKGSNHGNSKLTEYDIPNIVSMFPIYDNAYIARQFNVNISSIRNIKIGKTWTHITKL